MSDKPTASSSTSRSRKARKPATDLTQDSPVQDKPAAKRARGKPDVPAEPAAKPARTRVASTRAKAVSPVAKAAAVESSADAKPRRGRPRKAATTETVAPAPEASAAIEPVAAEPAAVKTPAAKATRARARKVVEPVAVPEPESEPARDAKPEAAAKRGRGRPRKIAAEPTTPEAPVEAAAAPAPKARRAPRRTKPVEAAPAETPVAVLPEPTPEPIAEAAPKRGRGRPRKIAVPAPADTVPTAEERAADAEEAPAKPPRTRRKALPKTVEASSTAEQPVAETAPEPAATEQAPEPQGPLFAELGLSEPIMAAIRELGYLRPTPIQAGAIPMVLSGRDVLGVAQTGTGKTASFVLPLLETLSGSRARARMPRSLILEPTRELALQVAENFKLYGKNLRLTHALLIGGESMKDQREILGRGVDVLIATPGRLIDLFERGGLLLTQTRHLVIDEADRMLDMGFIPDIEKIVGLLPPNRQTLFFSATMAPEIRRLADAFLNTPEEITVARQSSVATTIEESLVIVPEEDKRRTLRKLLRQLEVQSAIVFSNRKRDVDMLLKSLTKHGFSAGALHGDLPQSVRFATLERFRASELSILVCSDVAARGIDIGGLGHVFNFDLPFNAEDYVHRIGRTGRAGKKGHAISLASPYDKHLADAIETLTGRAIPQPAYAGITPAEWAPEDEARERGGRHRDKKRHGKDRNRGHDAPRPAEHGHAKAETPAPTHREPQQPHEPRQETKRPEARRHEGTRVEAQRPDPQRREAPKPQERRPSVVAEAQFDHTAPQTGFGHDTPAFMLLPRRARQKQGD